MPRTEEGEYELVLGNRQLLSIIFIIMVLFGVVFSLGYFMGRNTAPEAISANVVPARPASPEPASPAPERADTTAQPAPAGASQGPATLEPGQATIATQPAPTPDAQARQAAGAAQPTAQPETRPPASAPAQPERARGAAEEPLPPEPAPGQTFLQVAAVRRPEAELIADVLKKKGFAAIVAPGPNETLFRVLVGPLKDQASLAKTQAGLEGAGFKAIVRKYR